MCGEEGNYVDKESQGERGAKMAYDRGDGKGELEMVDEKTDEMGKRMRKQSKGMGVEATELSVELQTGRPGVEPVEETMDCVYQTRF